MLKPYTTLIAGQVEENILRLTSASYFLCFAQPLFLSAAHSANSTLGRPASHWSRGWRQIAVIGPFTDSPQRFAPTTAAQWQSAPRIHLFKGPTGPIVCEMVHLGVFERFSGGRCTRFGDLSSWEPAGGACLGRWGSLMEYWQIRLSARFDRGANQEHTILPLAPNGSH